MNEHGTKRTKQPADLDKFIKCRTQFNLMLDRKKSAYYQNLIENNRGNLQQLFQVFHKLRQKNKETDLPGHTCLEDLKNRFSEYLQAKIAHINEQFTDNTYEVPGIVHPTSTLHEFMLVSEDTVRKFILKSPQILDKYKTETIT